MLPDEDVTVLNAKVLVGIAEEAEALLTDLENTSNRIAGLRVRGRSIIGVALRSTSTATLSATASVTLATAALVVAAASVVAAVLLAAISLATTTGSATVRRTLLLLAATPGTAIALAVAVPVVAAVTRILRSR